MKSTPWALIIAVGLLSIAAQVVVFYARFGRWNTDSTFTDYLFFFLAGALGGWILTYFLNRQPSGSRRRAVWISFLLASPIAFIMMIGGGLLGLLGVLIFPQIPWALSVWVGSSAGNWVAKD